jgi:hypothetical protein
MKDTLIDFHLYRGQIKCIWRIKAVPLRYTKKLKHMKSIHALILFVVSFALSSKAQTTYTISSSGFTYSPDSVSVNVGDQVTFNSDFLDAPAARG